MESIEEIRHTSLKIAASERERGGGREIKKFYQSLIYVPQHPDQSLGVNQD